MIICDLTSQFVVLIDCDNLCTAYPSELLSYPSILNLQLGHVCRVDLHGVQAVHETGLVVGQKHFSIAEWTNTA